MQATVRSFDPATGSGSVFLDDGTVCVFSGVAFALSGLRLLRAGQRVSIRRDRVGAITALTLPTLPFPAEPGGSADPGRSPARYTEAGD